MTARLAGFYRKKLKDRFVRVADGSELIEVICHENQSFLKLTGRAPE
jgi:hypothetical protein